MRILIAYGTHHGSSEKAAIILKSMLKAEVVLHNLKNENKVDLKGFDCIIIGGSIHMGAVNKKVKKFCDDNTDILLSKKNGIFLCCMDKEKAQTQFENSFDEKLRVKAVANGLFGGEFLFEKMNWIERLMVKKITGVHKTTSEISEEAIGKFANLINS